MSKDSRKIRRSRVVTSLQCQLDLLTQDCGVYREDLHLLLEKELADLCSFWGLNPGDNISKLRTRIIDRLDAHFEAIPPLNLRAKGQRRQKLRRAYDLSFNIHTSSKIQSIRKKNDRQRYIRMADPSYDNVASSFETAGEDLLFAYAEVEKQILDTGFSPKVPVSIFGISVEFEKGDITSNNANAETGSYAQELKASDSLATESSARSSIKSPVKKRRRLIALVIAAMLLVVAGIVVPVVVFRASDRPEGYISIQNSPFDFQVGQTTSPDLVIPRLISEIERPPPYDGVNLAEFDAWKAKYKAVHANAMHVTFVARGQVSEPSVILDARVEIVRREAPLDGTWIKPDGGGPGAVRELYANLDRESSELTTDGTWQFPLLVSNSEPEIFTVTARTTNCHCYWRVVLIVNLPNNEAANVVVDDKGKPFEITSSTAATDRTYLAYGPGDAWPRPVP